MNLTTLRGWWQRQNTRCRLLEIGLLVAVLLLGTCWYIAAKDRVCLIVDGRATVIGTRVRRVEDLLATAGVKLGKGDKVEPEMESSIREGLTITVRRAFPVDMIIGGKTLAVLTVARPVRELLDDYHVVLGESDLVQPGLAEEIKPGQKVKVVRVSTKELTYREEIPAKVVVREDSNLDRGVRRVLKEGSSGLVERTARVQMEDGRVRSRNVLSTKWLRWPVTRVVALGTRPIVHTFLTSRGQVVRYTDTFEMTATAYYPGPESCGVNAKGITRTGARATFGVVAVDPKVIPLGTRLYVEGYGFATALDTGSAIKGKKIDLCYDTYREAIMYGKRKIKVYIIAK